jgi:hypothetical protein
VNNALRTVDARAGACGGTMPAAITAAMICNDVPVPVVRPPTATAMAQPTNPGAMAGRSAMANAMNPASTGTRNPNAAEPIRDISVAQLRSEPASNWSVTSATTCGSSGAEPADPWVSTSMVSPFALAVCSSDSAAMYVCDARRARGDGDELHAATSWRTYEATWAR